MLAILRHQIEIAQGRAPADARLPMAYEAAETMRAGKGSSKR
jgi:hypothetical protein